MCKDCKHYKKESPFFDTMLCENEKVLEMIWGGEDSFLEFNPPEDFGCKLEEKKDD